MALSPRWRGSVCDAPQPHPVVHCPASRSNDPRADPNAGYTVVYFACCLFFSRLCPVCYGVFFRGALSHPAQNLGTAVAVEQHAEATQRRGYFSWFLLLYPQYDFRELLGLCRMGILFFVEY